jgi:acyl-CoA thioesterase FadM
MKLFFRLIGVTIKAARRPRLELFDESVVRFRVWPSDLDFNRHMNNGRYLTIMDLGRIDAILRAGLFGTLHREGWRPVVAAQTIDFRRPLRLFRRFSLHTRLICWDEKFFYIEQVFVSQGRVMATALVKAAVLAKGRSLKTRDLLEAAGWSRRSPAMPPGIKAWALATEWMAERNPSQARGSAGQSLDAPEEEPSPAKA